MLTFLIPKSTVLLLLFCFFFYRVFIAIPAIDDVPKCRKRKTRNGEPETRNREPGMEPGNEITAVIRVIISKLRMIGSEKDLEAGLRCR